MIKLDHDNSGIEEEKKVLVADDSDDRNAKDKLLLKCNN